MWRICRAWREGPLIDLIEPENFDFALKALLPGFIIVYVYLSRKKAPLPATSKLIIASVVGSFLYDLLLRAILYFSPLPSVPQAVADGLNLAFWPLFIALLSAAFSERIRKIFSVLGFHLRSEIPSAWDFAFSDRKACWVIVHLKNGEKIRGEFSGNSLASSTPQERDLYIDVTYDYSLYGGWVKPKRKTSVFISASTIESIEFIEPREENE